MDTDPALVGWARPGHPTASETIVVVMDSPDGLVMGLRRPARYNSQDACLAARGCLLQRDDET